jgi:ABC-type branched-subunit amino acid transport system ATPase component
MMAAILEISKLSKVFDGVKAVNEVSLAVEAQRIVSLIGPNGAGKTTLFNLVCGFLPRDRGTIVFRGEGLDGMGPHRIARLGIGRTFQDLRLIRKVSVLDNVMLGFQHQAGEGVLHALAGWKTKREERRNLDKARGLLEFVGLAEKAGDLAEALSYGQQKLLTLACCLAMDAQLLLLDEPVAGIEPETSHRILELLQELRSQGKTIFLIEHNLEAVRAISDFVVVMDEGRKIAEGTPEAVMQDPVVLDAYLT